MKLRIQAHELQMLNVPSWRVDEKEKQKNIQACKKAIEEAKAELIQLYKSLIIDCESELELLQPEMENKNKHIILKGYLQTCNTFSNRFPDSYVWEKRKNQAKDKLAAYEAKHNINPENK